jgi:glycosyltransferase involved in cell wall biosynthesis
MNSATDREKSARCVFVFDRVMHYHVDLFRQLDARLQQRGIELHLLSGRRAERELGRVAMVEQVIPAESKFLLRDWRVGSFVFRLALGYLKRIRELRPEVVVCPAHPGDLGHWALIWWKRHLNYRLVAWQCGYEYNPGCLKRWLLKHFVPSFDYHLAYHSNARRYALEHGAGDSQAEVMHNTLNEAKFVITGKREALAMLRQRHPEIGERRLVLYVGAVLAEKNLERIVDAMAGLGRDDAVLMIVGDGPHLPVLRAATAERNDVVFAGQVIEGVGIYFDAAEVYVLPGTGGLGINEAMVHSLPIISGYADGSADDLVVDGENGYRLREDSVEELRDRIRQILDSPALVARMGAKSREWITGKFSFQHFLDRVESRVVQQIEARRLLDSTGSLIHENLRQ